jgi:hypothetical protein
LATKEWHRELQARQDKAEERWQENVKMAKFDKYDTTREDYDSWEQSDYELDESDINPTI